MSRFFFLMMMATVICLWGCKPRQFDYKRLTDKVRISTSESSAAVGLSSKAATKLRTDRFYSWYDKGIIGITQGGYSGKVLHGKYTEWYADNKQLRTQGEYRLGVKTGRWMVWARDGKLSEKQRWKSGKQVLAKPKRSLKSRLMKRIPFKRKTKP